MPSINPVPEIVFFDAAGTLIHIPEGVSAHYCRVAERWGIRLSDEVAVGKAFGRAWKETPPPAETRQPRPDDDKGWWRTLVRRVFAHLHVAEEHWSEEFFDDLYRHFQEPGVWKLYEDAIPALERTRKGSRLGIVSNFDGRLRRVLEHLGIADWFDVWAISSEVGSDKPSGYIYEYALRQAGVTADRALHVGDDPECDWAGAEAAGLRVFRLDRPRNSLADLVLG